MLTATGSAAPSPGLPEERRPCPEGAGLSPLPQLWAGGGRLLCASPLPGVEGVWGITPGAPPKNSSEGGRRRTPAPGNISPAGAEPGAGFAALGQGSPCPPGSGRGFGQAGAGRGRQHAPDSEANPPFGFSAAGRPAGQRGILAAAFPTDLSKGQAAYANDFNKYFFRRNIITEHKLGFNSRLITRGGRRVRGDGRAGRGAAAGEAPSPLRI